MVYSTSLNAAPQRKAPLVKSGLGGILTILYSDLLGGNDG